MSRFIALLIICACSTAIAQTWPDYHLTNGTHYTSFGVEDYEPANPIKNLYIDPTAILQAGSTELDSIYDANQVYLNGGTVYASAIDADDFTWNSGSLYLNGGTHSTTYGLDSGTGKILNIDSGATVQQVFLNSLPSGNELNLNYGGKLSVVDFDASLSGFYYNEGGTLEVAGLLTGFDSTVFYHGDQNLILRGSDASWNAGHLSLGSYPSYGYDCQLSVLDGAEVNSTSLYTEERSGFVEVSGAGSKLTTGGLGVSDAQLLIDNGGVVESGNASLGGEGGGGYTRVSGSNSELIVNGALFVGHDGGAARGPSLNIESGGKVSCSELTIARDSERTSVTVEGAGSELNVAGELILAIGRRMGGNHLRVLDGAKLTSQNCQIGRSFDDNGFNSLRVSGTDSEWINGGSLTIGEGGGGGGDGQNQVIIEDGGKVYIGDTITVYNHEWDNGVYLNTGGKLTIGTNFNASIDGFNYNAGSTLAVQGQLSGLSTLETDRRLEAASVLGDMTVHGTFAPGNSPADSILDGILTIAADGTLEMELGGLLLGDEYDRLTVTDSAYLDGTLDIVLLDDFSLAYGDSFDLFNWDGGVSGEFETISTSALTGDLEWDTSELYTTGTITVIPEPSSVAMIGLVGCFGVFVRRRLMW